MDGCLVKLFLVFCCNSPSTRSDQNERTTDADANSLHSIESRTENSSAVHKANVRITNECTCVPVSPHIDPSWLETMVSFGLVYVVSAYVVFPLGAYFWGNRQNNPLVDLYYRVCPIVKCIGPLIDCVKEEDTCKEAVLDCLVECEQDLPNDDDDSNKNNNRNNPVKSSRRRQDVFEFHRDHTFVQHPDDPNFCQYSCFHQITTQTAEKVLECMGASKCLAPTLSRYSDTCWIPHNYYPTTSSIKVLPFDERLATSLPGSWNKLFSSGWDVWPCQATYFTHSVNNENGDNDDTWNMHLYWNNTHNTYTFHMYNQMFPNQQWDFESKSTIASTSPTTTKTTFPSATLKTRAYMWGTEAHENWYIVDFDVDYQTLIVYYCAYTADIDRYDSITMILRKEQETHNGDDSRMKASMTKEMENVLQDRAKKLLGDTYGSVVRIKDCPA